MYTLDTNAIIYFLKDDERAVNILKEIFDQNQIIYISTITEVELFGFSDIRTEEISRIDAILKTLAIIPLDSHIARTAGFLRRFYKTQTADSVIAATALFTGTTLLTRNTRDFKNIPDLALRPL